MTVGISISVFIPCYNAAPFLEEVLDSIAAQTHPVNEMIVVVDRHPEVPRRLTRFIFPTFVLRLRDMVS